MAIKKSKPKRKSRAQEKSDLHKELNENEDDSTTISENDWFYDIFDENNPEKL